MPDAMHSPGEAARPTLFKPTLVRDADSAPIRLTVDGMPQSALGRALLVLYNSIAKGGLPTRAALRPADLAPYEPGLALYELVPGQHDYVLRQWGPDYVALYGDMTGRRLSEVAPNAARERAFAAIDLAISAERPVFARAPIGNLAGERMVGESLVLPFTGPGGAGRLVLAYLTVRPDPGRAQAKDRPSHYQSFP